jgi:hypothetical protein
MKKYKVKMVIPATSVREYEIEGNSKQEVIDSLKNNYISLSYITENITVESEDGEVDSIEEIE